MRSSPFTGLSDLSKWNMLRHDSGQSEDPVCNDIFINAGSEEYFEVEKVEHKNSNLIHLTYNDSNKSGSNQVGWNQSGSNHVAAHYADLNHVIFDSADSTNIN